MASLEESIELNKEFDIIRCRLCPEAEAFISRPENGDLTLKGYAEKVVRHFKTKKGDPGHKPFEVSYKQVERLLLPHYPSMEVTLKPLAEVSHELRMSGEVLHGTSTLHARRFHPLCAEAKCIYTVSATNKNYVSSFDSHLKSQHHQTQSRDMIKRDVQVGVALRLSQNQFLLTDASSPDLAILRCTIMKIPSTFLVDYVKQMENYILSALYAYGAK